MIHIELNIAKNPTWLKSNPLAIYKRGWGFELGTIVKNIQVVVRRDRIRNRDHWIASPTVRADLSAMHASFPGDATGLKKVTF